MASYTDQEEIEKLKVWWKNYGGALLIGVLLGLVLLFGNKYWSEYKEKQRIAASELYAQLLQEVQESKRDVARTDAQKLIDDYSRTPYAGMAALMQARLSFEAGDAADVRKRLEWAIDHATDSAVVHTARLRLGRLLLANKEYDAALALTQKSGPGFESEYLELKGDALLGQGKPEEARTAYSDAIKQLPAQATSRRLLEMKLADIGGASPQ